MAGFGNNMDIDVKSSYEASFKDLEDGTIYADEFGHKGRIGSPIELRNLMNETFSVERKALDSDSGIGGTDKVLTPLYVDPRIVDITRVQTPAVSMFPRVTNKGLNANFNVLTGKGGAAFELEDATLTETDSSTVRKTVDIKYMYAVGRTTGVAQAAQPSWVLEGLNHTGSATGGFSNASASNASNFNVLIKSREIKELEEQTIFNGDIVANIKEFDGIIKTIGVENQTDLVGATSVTIDNVDTSVRNAFNKGGFVNVGFCDIETYGDLKRELATKIGFLASKEEVTFGFRHLTITTISGNVKIIPSRYLSSTTGSKSIFLLDMSVWEMRVLQDMTMEPLAKTNDSSKFMIKQYLTLICRAIQFNASIVNAL